MAEEMIQVKAISEGRLDEIAAEIGALFYDYPYEAGEGGLKAMIPSREAMNAYVKALVRTGIANGTFYAVLEEGILVPPKPGEKSSIMKTLFAKKRRKLHRSMRS